MRVADRSILETPIAVLDFETTGLSPGLDRVVEVSVVRFEPGQQSRLMVDSLVNPGRGMAGTEIHGITAADVADAPRFEDLVPTLLQALDGAIVAAHNAYFDMRFLEFELERAGNAAQMPFLCTMYMRPMLDLGKRCRLVEACATYGIAHGEQHRAANDAWATARLLERYVETIEGRDIATFDRLRAGKKYKFLKSWDLQLPRFDVTPSAIVGQPRKSREPANTPNTPVAPDPSRGIREYQAAVLDALADEELTDAEASTLRSLREQWRLSLPQIKAVHARIFAAALNARASDDIIDGAEEGSIHRLHEQLACLGWSPAGALAA